MATTYEQVLAALQPEEPDYSQAARLGTEAIPFLEVLATGDHTMLAAKAIYLAGLIGSERGIRLVEAAGRSAFPTLRAAAAGTSRNLPSAATGDFLALLVEDADTGVQKLALRSLSDEHVRNLRPRLESLRDNDSRPVAQQIAREILERTRR